MYYIISMKHTSKIDKYICLWGADNSGYYTSIEGAGLYENPIDDYHNSPPDSIPIEKERLDKLTIEVVQKDKTFHCIPNCAAVLEQLGMKFNRKGDLILK